MKVWEQRWQQAILHLPLPKTMENHILNRLSSQQNISNQSLSLKAPTDHLCYSLYLNHVSGLSLPSIIPDDYFNKHTATLSISLSFFDLESGQFYGSTWTQTPSLPIVRTTTVHQSEDNLKRTSSEKLKQDMAIETTVRLVGRKIEIDFASDYVHEHRFN
jgi:hypothetical protein